MYIKKLLTLSFITTFLIGSAITQAASPVWKVSKGKDSIFIGGTVHLLRTSDYPIPKAFENAYRQSDSIFFEADIASGATAAFQQKMAKALIYPKGTTLKQFLSEKTYKHLEKHTKSLGLPVEQVSTFRPGMLSMMLTVVEMKKLGFVNETGLDKFFTLRAINDEKTLGFLESLDQQIEFIAAMGEGNEDAVVAYTLRDLHGIKKMMPPLMKYWRTGDMKKLDALVNTSMKKDFPKVYQQLLVTRNMNWMPKIEALFSNKETEFVLVGAMHLAGDDSVLKMLADKGYKIEQMN